MTTHLPTQPFQASIEHIRVWKIPYAVPYISPVQTAEPLIRNRALIVDKTCPPSHNQLQNQPLNLPILGSGVI